MTGFVNRIRSARGGATRVGRLLLAGGVAAGVGLLLLFPVLDAICPFPRERLREAQSGGATRVLDAEGNLLAWRVGTRDEWRLPVRLADVSPWLIDATVAAEDKRFWEHGGVDPAAALRALGQNLRYRRRVSGASTITMQTMRLLTPRRRTWSAKATESFRALQLEGCATKELILEAYLNCAPYGGNVIGVEAAARRYFGRSARDLTLGEAALLAGLPQSPARFNPRTHMEAALERRTFVLARMLALGMVTEADLAAALREPPALVPREKHLHAPHAVEYLLTHMKNQGGTLRASLVADVQDAVSRIVARHAADLTPSGVDGVAAVVIDVRESTLVAMVGNPRPEHPVTGLVNGATARRQPGSLLKPFLYALAYESGWLTPGSLVYDIPTAWRGYAPENMDRDYRGPMSAADALAASRNLPAVRLLDRLGTDVVAERMARLGLPLSGPPERFGLSLALGTAEMRLVDLAGAYACLARMGVRMPLRLLADEPPHAGERALAPGAAWLTLRSLGAPESGAAWKPVWKTGTSWNFRDAWAIVMTPRHVVAVWCGCLSGGGNGRLIGAETALPLALKLSGAVTPADTRSWTRPDGVAVRRVCALSGRPAGMACPHLREDESLSGQHDLPCTLHIAAAGAPAGVRWPDEVARFLAGRNPTPAATKGLAILSPAPDAIYMVSGQDAGTPATLDLVADAPADARTYWFLNGAPLGSTSGRAPLTWPLAVGAHGLSAADASGASASIRFIVRALGETRR